MNAVATHTYSFPWANAVNSRSDGAGPFIGGVDSQLLKGYITASGIYPQNPVWNPSSMWHYENGNPEYSWYDAYGAE